MSSIKVNHRTKCDIEFSSTQTVTHFHRVKLLPFQQDFIFSMANLRYLPKNYYLAGKSAELSRGSTCKRFRLVMVFQERKTKTGNEQK